MGGGGGIIHTYDARQALQTARGITRLIRMVYEGFFTQAFGIDPVNIDNMVVNQSLDDIANLKTIIVM